jgi:hypothetical protein
VPLLRLALNPIKATIHHAMPGVSDERGKAQLYGLKNTYSPVKPASAGRTIFLTKDS